ncbi:MAG: thermonuclease family protein [Defluviitaleaceae bacterium]|nr:thermonuclease family protein [Defluviitaleaceae bacterium]MCL2274851.1 thermonuclease family protein [Defluviitaleaceae bacterium]
MKTWYKKLPSALWGLALAHLLMFTLLTGCGALLEDLQTTPTLTPQETHTPAQAPQVPVPTPSPPQPTPQPKLELEEVPEAPPLPHGLTEAIVSHVIDGDTIELTTGERVRFIGINTPEDGEAGAAEATAFVRSRIEGQTVWLEPDGNNTDRHDRLRRFIWLQIPTDPNNEAEILAYQLNAQLLESGHATAMIVGTMRHEALFTRLSPAPTPEPEPTITMGIISAPTQARRSEVHTIVFQGEPNTIYNLSILSAARTPRLLTAAGLGYATSNGEGIVSWTWLVGPNTGAGTQRATISGGGKMVRHEIRIVVN